MRIRTRKAGLKPALYQETGAPGTGRGTTTLGMSARVTANSQLAPTSPTIFLGNAKQEDILTQ